MGREFVARKSSVWGKKSDTKPSLFTSRPFAVQTREQNTVNKKELPSEIPPANYITDKIGLKAPQATVQRQEDNSEIKEQEPDLMSKSDESPVGDEEETVSPQLEEQNKDEETVSPQLEDQNKQEEKISPQLEEQNKQEEIVSPQLEDQSEEENLDKKSIQTKLTVGEPGDKYEQEADTVAAKVVEHINSPKSQQPVQGKVEPVVQPTLMRQGGAGKGTVNRDVEQNIQQARGGGQGLADNVRQPMEQAFGADFSGVKVHTGGQADVLNRSLNSRAFATGQDIFFKQGEYNPGSRGGQELLAHELTHVVQQGGQTLKQSPSAQTKSILPISSYTIQSKTGNQTKQPGEVYAPFVPTYLPPLAQGQWYNIDREVNPTDPSRSFWKASIYNTLNNNHWAYRSIAQRHAFYKFADAYLNTVNKAIKSQWFAAAAIVTGEYAVGAAEGINLWYLYDNTEEFLKAGNKFLFKYNMKNFRYLMEGKDIPDPKLKGLKGQALDNALVEFEQTKVQEFITNYKGSGSLKEMIQQINSSFNAWLAPSEIKEVLKKHFTDKGIKFDFKNYEHRVILGKQMVNNLYKKRKIKGKP